MARRQTLVQLSDELIAALDERAAQRQISRSQLIRTAIEQYITNDEGAAIDRAIVEGYTRIPPDDDPWTAALARESMRRLEPW